MDEFRTRHGLGSMTTVVDDDGTLWPHFGVRAQPAWLFVTPDGDVDRVLGELSREQLRERLDALAGEGGG
ncbi:MAG TPA: hypothetical protein VK906_18695 [Egicoccus sp.]|nr:hypothetical protein [Egicoccus sp.]HSK25223.1 hypothetical protein [Egicoccus sp.]